MLVPSLFNMCVEDCRCMGCFENFPHLSETDPISMVSLKFTCRDNLGSLAFHVSKNYLRIEHAYSDFRASVLWT